jgi:hypothetical protein
VLRHVYPDADVAVVQLSINKTQPMALLAHEFVTTLLPERDKTGWNWTAIAECEFRNSEWLLHPGSCCFRCETNA